MKTGVETDIILYLGLCNGAGWATSLDGRTCGFARNRKNYLELNWQDESAMQALIFHEGHIWHKTYGNLYPEARSEGENSLAPKLYQEGLAMVCNIFYAKMTDTSSKSKRLARLVQNEAGNKA